MARKTKQVVIASFLKMTRPFIFQVRNWEETSIRDMSFVAKRKIYSQQTDVVRTAEFVQLV